MASATTQSEGPSEERIAAVRAELVETDGEPLESPWHRAAINLLIESILEHWRGRTDFFVGGNMFIYYSRTQARNRKYKGPDFFFVNQVDGARKRRYWWVYEEDGRFPDVIIELNSPTTIKADFTTKKELYEKRFKTPEYYCYDPDSLALVGWRLGYKGYEPIQPNERGWLWSDQLRLWVGVWKGQYLGTNETWLRFYDESRELVQTQLERVHAQNDALADEVAQLKAKLTSKKKSNGKNNGRSS